MIVSGSTKLVTILAAATALGATGCSRLDITWTPRAGALEIAARGFDDAELVLLSGPATGPLVQLLLPEVWTTIGPTPAGALTEVRRVPFEHGAATLIVRPTDITEATLVQALVQSRTPRQNHHERPMLGVSACYALSWSGETPLLERHALVVLKSRTGLFLLGAAGMLAAAVLAHRVHFRASRLRRPAVAVLFVAAAWLALDSLLADAPAPRRETTADPLDRVTRPGLAALIDAARGAIRDGDVILVQADGPSGESHRDAAQVTWRLWPHRAALVTTQGDVFARRGTYVILGSPPARRGTAAFFANQAGSVWRIDEGEPR